MDRGPVILMTVFLMLSLLPRVEDKSNGLLNVSTNMLTKEGSRGDVNIASNFHYLFGNSFCW